MEFLGPYIFVRFSLIGSQSYADSYLINTVYLDSALALSLSFAVIWYISFFTSRGRLFYSVGADARWNLSPTGRKFSKPTVYVFVLLMILFSSVLIFTHPGLGQGLRSQLTGSMHGRVMFASIGMTMIVFWIYAASVLKNRIRSFSALALLSATSILYGAILIQLGGRLRAAEMLIGLVFIVHYLRFRLSIHVAVIIFSLALMMLVLQRYDFQGAEFDFFAFFFGLEGGRNFDAILNLAEILERFPGSQFGWGSGMLNSVLADIGISFSENSRQMIMRNVFGFEDVHVGFSATKAAEAYVDFGVLGSLVFAAILGFLAARVQIITIHRGFFGVASVPFYFVLQWNLGLSDPVKYLSSNLVFTIVYIATGILALVFLFGYHRFRISRNVPVRTS